MTTAIATVMGFCLGWLGSCAWYGRRIAMSDFVIVALLGVAGLALLKVSA